jgi:hypothetical protein
MRSMNELRPFYRLLSIPEDTDAPTPFQLLGLPAVHSAALTREQIEQAVLERKKLLRQSIPGPHALPIMSLVEQTIDRAAAKLLQQLGLAAGHSPEHSGHGTGGPGSDGPHPGPTISVEQAPRPVEHTPRPAEHTPRPAAHTPRSHAKHAVAGDPAAETWQDALHWVIAESRSLYEQARRQNDLSSAAEALRSYLTARRFLQIIDKE